MNHSKEKFYGKQVEIIEDQDYVESFGEGDWNGSFVMVVIPDEKIRTEIPPEHLTIQYSDFAGLHLLFESSGPRRCTRCGKLGHEAYEVLK